MTSWRVLLVEDDPAVARLLLLLFRSRGHLVDSCRTGEDALRLAHEHRYDVAVCDLRLPGMDGLVLGSMLRALDEENGSDLALVGITGYEVIGLGADAPSYGFDGVITKPLKVKTFMTAVEAIVASRRGGGG